MENFFDFAVGYQLPQVANGGKNLRSRLKIYMVENFYYLKSNLNFDAYLESSSKIHRRVDKKIR